MALGGSGGPVVPTQIIGAKSSFTVLGKGISKKKKEIVEEAPEDWEREVEAWDQ